MKITAAILTELGKPLVITEIESPVLKPGQVLVEISFSGICHTQILEARGYRGEDKFLPHCLGHEGSGMVREVGSSVSKVKEGDKVILSWIKGSGADVPGTVYTWNGKNVNSGAITTFSRFSVISENRLTAVPGDVPLNQAALIGCAVPTGLGAVLNTANPKAGQSLVVFGTGGVGLMAVAGAKIAGCDPIIAVDINNEKLKLAAQLGATILVNSLETDPVATVNSTCKGGIDFAVESTGRTQVMLQAISCLRSQGGTAVIVGNARAGEKLELDPKHFNMGKRLLGTWGGDSKPDSDYPRYAEFVRSGKLDLRPLITKVYKLEDINTALDDLESGKVIRPLIDMSIR